MATIAEGHEELNDGTWYSLVDEEGNLLLQTANTVHVDDLYITAENARYIVERIEDHTAICRYDGMESMPDLSSNLQKAELL